MHFIQQLEERKKRDHQRDVDALSKTIRILQEYFGLFSGQGRPYEHLVVPLNKLMPPKSTMVKMPGNYLSISRELVLRCQIMLGRWEMFRVETDLLVTEVDKLQWRAVSQRARHFQKHVYQECKETKEDEGEESDGDSLKNH